jgi:hypothetical protein
MTGSRPPKSHKNFGNHCVASDVRLWETLHVVNRIKALGISPRFSIDSFLDRFVTGVVKEVQQFNRLLSIVSLPALLQTTVKRSGLVVIQMKFVCMVLDEHVPPNRFGQSVHHAFIVWDHGVQILGDGTSLAVQ